MSREQDVDAGSRPGNLLALALLAPVALRRRVRARAVNDLGMARPATLTRPRKGGGDRQQPYDLAHVDHYSATS